MEYLLCTHFRHLIDFQLEAYFKGKDRGREIERIYSMGRLIPQYWMQKAVGNTLSVDALLKATSEAAVKVK